MKTLVHLLRHGEVHNPQGILYGRAPGYRLSTRGGQMAERVAERVGDRDITHVVASPLERAQQTAAPLAKARGLAITTDDRIIESTNVFEGKPFSVGDGVIKVPSAWKYLWNPFRPTWGEPYKEVAERMWSAVLDTPGPRPRGTRPCWSPTSCRSGSPACEPSGVVPTSTTHASASAPSAA
jgi:broad specificity phosphatase PhoE